MSGHHVLCADEPIDRGPRYRASAVKSAGAVRALTGSIVAVAIWAVWLPRPAASQDQRERPERSDVDAFFAAASLDELEAAPARVQIAAGWRAGDAAILVDLLDLLRRTSMVNPAAWIRLSRLTQFLEAQTGQPFGVDVNRWHDYVWSLPYDPHPGYGRFKGALYGQLDPGFEAFFTTPLRTAIRLDEVQWGGVGINGIPPLDHPVHLPAAEAAYMADDNIVFGVTVKGASRAYPKRILAWHELARDDISGEELTIVYCTLCGTVIPYESRVGGRLRVFGTSGLLYRSNKLMFDEETNTLWSSLDGTPAVGPLVGSGLRLSFRPVVTTTWGEWRRAHPDTTVVSLETGYQRDYSEGAAYRSYFASDNLMFAVSRMDFRLANKAEVLALRLPGAGDQVEPVAIAADFLRAQPVYHLDGSGGSLVVITSPEGANRVYDTGTRRFTRLDAQGRVVDAQGSTWTVTEDALRATSDQSLQLPRVPAHRAFWFGWYAQYPNTRLIN
jgi:hypothetical protein